jgi:hypothetical protein
MGHALTLFKAMIIFAVAVQASTTSNAQNELKTATFLGRWCPIDDPEGRFGEGFTGYVIRLNQFQIGSSKCEEVKMWVQDNKFRVSASCHEDEPTGGFIAFLGEFEVSGKNRIQLLREGEQPEKLVKCRSQVDPQ